MLPQENITADKGREGKLNIDLVANRLMSLQTFFALDGRHWLAELRQMSAENEELSALGLAVADVARATAKIPQPEMLDEPDDEDPATTDIEDA